MVDELSCDPPGRGPLETRQDAAFVLGIDLGGTKLHAALADAAGAVLSEALEPTDPRGGLAIVAQIGALHDRLAREAGLRAGGLRCAVLGSPGVFDPRSGRIGIAANIPDFDRIGVAEELGRRLGCPVLIENDVNLAAMGEQWQGCCRDVRDFAFVALGTGIGLGLVLDGRLVRGARGAAGEIAFLPIGSDPSDPRARLHGAFETAVGSAAILGRYRGFGGSAATDVRGVFDALAGGDEAAAATLDETARLLVQGLMAVRAVVDPALIVLGGSIGVREELVTRVRGLVARHPGDLLRVEPSMLGSRAAVIGAVGAALARLRGGPFDAAGPQSGHVLATAQPAGRRS